MLLAHGSHQRSRKGEDRLRTLDTVIGGESITLILVADGHGGTMAVEHVAAHLLDRVLDAADDGSGDGMERAVTCAFRAIHEDIRRLDTTSGATVMVCCINYARCELGVWNVGDTLGLLVEEHSELQLGTSHRLNDNPDELRRVAKLGVKVGRAKDAEGKAFGPLRCFPGGTTMTRTLGDTDCGEHISPEPSSRTGIPLPTAGGALVVCSDGVWDRLKVERMAKLLRMPRTRMRRTRLALWWSGRRGTAWRTMRRRSSSSLARGRRASAHPVASTPRASRRGKPGSMGHPRATRRRPRSRRGACTTAKGSART